MTNKEAEKVLRPSFAHARKRFRQTEKGRQTDRQTEAKRLGQTGR